MKTVLVTGALGQTGQHLISEFKDKGYFVIGTDRKSGHCGCDAFINLDVMDLVHGQAQSTLNAWMRKLLKDGKLSVLVNNAAITKRLNAEEIDLEAWGRVMETNVIAPFVLIQALLPYLRHGRGTIINMGSVYPEWDTPGLSLYAASKSALLGMSRALSSEWKDSIRLFSIRTSPHLTPGQVGSSDDQLTKNTSSEGLACAVVEIAEKSSEFESGDSFEVNNHGQLRPVAPISI